MNYDTHFKQIILGILASASQVSSGMTLSFPAVALHAMNATCSLTSNQEFWIVGLPQISMIIGCISAGPILDRQGRRFALLLANLISLAGWFLMAVVPDLWSILTSRFLTGFAMGFVNPVFLVYVSEIASPDVRSGLTVANSITFSVGVTLTFLFGYFYRVKWRMVSWLCGLFPTACFILMVFVLPEPKMWTGKTVINKAKFKRPEVYKPMMIMLIALFFRQMNGSSVILSYTVPMIQQTKVIVDPYLVAVFIGLARTVGGIFSVWLSSKLGRRHPAIWSGLSMSLSMLALAASFDFPSFAFLMYILTSTVHISITQSMVAEVFPTDVRGVATSIAAVNIFLTGFLAILVHQWIRSDSFIMFTYYGIVGFSSTLFLFLFLPETHGKTLKEIEMIFNKHLINDEVALPINSSNQVITNYRNET